MELSKPFHRKKIVVIFLACILIFSGLSARVVYLMVFRAAHYSELALDLHQRERKIKAKRGRILDRAAIFLFCPVRSGSFHLSGFVSVLRSGTERAVFRRNEKNFQAV